MAALWVAPWVSSGWRRVDQKAAPTAVMWAVQWEMLGSWRADQRAGGWGGSKAVLTAAAWAGMRVGQMAGSRAAV